MIKDAKQFISKAGVPTVAQATKRSEAAVRVWKSRNRFPREAWLELNAAFPDLTLDVLRKIEKRAKPRDKASAQAA